MSGPEAVCQCRACESLTHNYLAMQHIIQSSSIQTFAGPNHPSERFVPSQQILVVVGSGGKASQVVFQHRERVRVYIFVRPSGWKE